MEKTIPCRWFMGCNSQNGFYSLFGQFTRPEEGWRCILIKGGPGTGKSTLMKRVIKLALQRGQPVEVTTAEIFKDLKSSGVPADLYEDRNRKVSLRRKDK